MEQFPNDDTVVARHIEPGPESGDKAESESAAHIAPVRQCPHAVTAKYRARVFAQGRPPGDDTMPG